MAGELEVDLGGNSSVFGTLTPVPSATYQGQLTITNRSEDAGHWQIILTNIGSGAENYAVNGSVVTDQVVVASGTVDAGGSVPVELELQALESLPMLMPLAFDLQVVLTAAEPQTTEPATTEPTPVATSTPEPSPSPTPEETPTSTPSGAPTGTESPSPSPSPSPSASSSATPSPTPTATVTQPPLPGRPLADPVEAGRQGNALPLTGVPGDVDGDGQIGAYETFLGENGMSHSFDRYQDWVEVVGAETAFRDAVFSPDGQMTPYGKWLNLQEGAHWDGSYSGWITGHLTRSEHTAPPPPTSTSDSVRSGPMHLGEVTVPATDDVVSHSGAEYTAVPSVPPAQATDQLATTGAEIGAILAAAVVMTVLGAVLRRQVDRS